MKETSFFWVVEKKVSKSARTKFFLKLSRNVSDVKLKVKTLCQPQIYMNPTGTASILHFDKRGCFGPYGPNRGDWLRVSTAQTCETFLFELLEKIGHHAEAQSVQKALALLFYLIWSGMVWSERFEYSPSPLFSLSFPCCSCLLLIVIFTDLISY